MRSRHGLRLRGDTAIVADPRFLALERRDLREAIQITAPIAVAVAISSALLFAIASPVRFPIAILVIVLLLGIWRLSLGRLRRRPHVAGFALIVSILLCRILTLYLDGSSANLAEAYFGLVVVASALFLPWSSRWHIAWLTVAGVIYGLAAFTLPAMADNRAYGIAYAVTAILISYAGNVLVQNRRGRRWSAELLLRDQRSTLREAQTRLRAAAHEDPLTGLSNRRRLDEDIAAISARMARRRFGMAAVMVDLDAFKAYNDSLGHPAGDKVLSASASAIRAAARAGDRVYRYGGEEILLLLEEGSRVAALAAAERVVRAVARLSLPHPAASIGHITVSAGSSASQGRSIALWAIIDEADRAMYQAKALGGDRAIAFQSAADEPGEPAGGVAETVPAPRSTIRPFVGAPRGAVSLGRGAGGR